jgi:hypothetical protein
MNIYVYIYLRMLGTFLSPLVCGASISLIFCVLYLSLIGRVYVFYIGHVDKSSLYGTLFHCNILSKHHHHY